MLIVIVILLLSGCAGVSTVCDYNINCVGEGVVCCKDIGLEARTDKTVNLTILCQSNQAYAMPQMRMIETG